MQACRQDAAREVSAEGGKSDEFAKACMVAKGYRFSAVPFDCGQGDQYENAACYTR
jgi:hypothetical protein